MSRDHQAQELHSLAELLDKIYADTEEQTVTIDYVISRIRHRGFGPLILVPAFLILPLGAIPFAPVAFSLVIILVCLQILMRREQPWLPKRVKEFAVSRASLNKGIDKSRPYMEKIDRFLHRRLVFFLNPVSVFLTALLCIIQSLLTIFLGFIPFLPDVVMIPVIFFGLGYLAQDGLLIAVGYALWVGSIIVAALMVL